MPRPGYTSFHLSEDRKGLFEIVCNHLALDASDHGARVQAVDFALRIAAREIEEMMMNDFLKDTLTMGQGEQRARFVNEMSKDERAQFAKTLLRQYRAEGLSKEDLVRAIPEAVNYC